MRERTSTRSQENDFISFIGKTDFGSDKWFELECLYESVRWWTKWIIASLVQITSNARNLFKKDSSKDSYSQSYLDAGKPPYYKSMLWWAKWIMVILVQITVSIYLLMAMRSNVEMTFEGIPQETKRFKTIQSFRQELTYEYLEKPVENKIWSDGFPVMIVSEDEFGANDFYGVKGTAKYVGAYLKKNTYSNDVYNGPMTFLFHRGDVAFFWILLEERGKRRVVGFENLVEHTEESKICATFQIHTKFAIYDVEMTDGCKFIQPLLHRWGSATRRFFFDYPANPPAEAEGANTFVLWFHREQPCHFSATYLKDREIIHSIPLKQVSYETSSGVSDGSFENVKTGVFTLQYFDGTIVTGKGQFSNLIKQSVQFYVETNRIYPLKKQIQKSFGLLPSFLDDIESDVWLTGPTFKYVVDDGKCYIHYDTAMVLLTKKSTKFFMNGNNIKIVQNLNAIYGEEHIVVFKGEHYGALIENDFKKCGIVQVISKSTTN